LTVTFKRKKSLTKHSRKKLKQRKEPAKKQQRDPTSYQPVIQGYAGRAKETKINEFEIETHQVAFDSDFSY
jgi:uncharacterized MAPEG superfamily protein